MTTPAKPRKRRPYEITKRDARMLTLLGEQFGMTYDHLSVWLGLLGPEPSGPLSTWGVRNQVDRWQDAGLVHCEKLLGRTWATLTGRGYARADLPYPLWRMPLSRLRHVYAVNDVRLAHATSANQGVWVSERALFVGRGKDTWHIGDAALVNGTDSPLEVPHRLVEVELTPKARLRYSTEVISQLHRNVTGLDYLVAPPHWRRVADDLFSVLQERHPNLALDVTVRPLPDSANYSK
jgi:hypothetical protein